MSIVDLLIGRPLPSSDEAAQQIGISKGIPIFGLDALSSAAYGPEAALTLLIPLGAAGLTYTLPLSLSIVALLIIVFFSYRQTIAAYPNGGGSYTVAKENLGTFAGLLAAAALMIDYVLTTAVGISAGIGALVSALPSLHSEILPLCLAALVLITLVNLRGVSETGNVFLVPTYLFLVSMLAVIVIGVFKTFASGGHPVPVVAHPPDHAVHAAAAVSAWILLKSFSSGCTALTGVETVSNGVRAFRDPAVQLAQKTLGIIISALVVMLLGIAYLVHSYRIMATDPDGSSYRSILSMLFDAVTGHGVFYYVAIGSVLLVLIFSANTAFTGFPRVCRILAEDRFLPISFANRGRRLVYSEGIWVLTILSGALLIGFRGITDRLIPLYAVGAFLAFTLSQAGMVIHWRKHGGAHKAGNLFINGLGAFSTGIALILVVVSKFVEGAWITVIAIPALLLLMSAIRKHYNRVIKKLSSPEPINLAHLNKPHIILPLQQWSAIAKDSLCAAFSLSCQITVVYVAEEDECDDFRKDWQKNVVEPARAANLPEPKLVVLNSPYRFVIGPIVHYILRLSDENPSQRIIAMVPELVEKSWYNYFLHAQRSALLKAGLLLKGNNRISVLNVPWYFQ